MAASELNGKTCLVTGASGFIGSVLCNMLILKGAKVKALLNSPKKGNWTDSFTCRLGEQDIPETILENIDIIFHLAGRSHALADTPSQSKHYFQTNVDGTRALLEAAKIAGVKKFIYFSSVKSICEENDSRLDENSVPNPTTAYGKSKLEAEKLVLQGGYVALPTVLRLVMVYGNTDKGNLPKLIKAMTKKWFPPLPKIENKRSMIHVDDVVDAAILVACSDVSAGKNYILCDGNDYSTRQIYEMIQNSLGRNVPSWSVPLFFMKIIAKVGDTYKFIMRKRFVFDSDLLQKLFGNSYYSSNYINSELGFTPKNNLFTSIDNIISSILYK